MVILPIKQMKTLRCGDGKPVLSEAGNRSQVDLKWIHLVKIKSGTKKNNLCPFQQSETSCMETGSLYAQPERRTRPIPVYKGVNQSTSKEQYSKQQILVN